MYVDQRLYRIPRWKAVSWNSHHPLTTVEKVHAVQLSWEVLPSIQYIDGYNYKPNLQKSSLHIEHENQRIKHVVHEIGRYKIQIQSELWNNKKTCGLREVSQ